MVTMSSTGTVTTTSAKPWAEREHPFSPSCYFPLDEAFRVYARQGKQDRSARTPRTRSTVSIKDPTVVSSPQRAGRRPDPRSCPPDNAAAVQASRTGTEYLG